jgi:dihydroxyacid dehydratase/phosphogluconate dehydratase
MGAGMEETYQITSSLRHLPFGKHVAIITDARFSGVSTGACIGHVSPEALAGGPIGRLRDGDLIQIVIDRQTLEGTVNMVGENRVETGIEEGSRLLESRQPRTDLVADALLPDDTRIWAALQEVSGGTWGGAVYDAASILKVIDAGREALAKSRLD